MRFNTKNVPYEENLRAKISRRSLDDEETTGRGYWAGGKGRGMRLGPGSCHSTKPAPKERRKKKESRPGRGRGRCFKRQKRTIRLSEKQRTEAR